MSGRASESDGSQQFQQANRVLQPVAAGPLQTVPQTIGIGFTRRAMRSLSHATAASIYRRAGRRQQVQGLPEWILRRNVSSRRFEAFSLRPDQYIGQKNASPLTGGSYVRCNSS